MKTFSGILQEGRRRYEGLDGRGRILFWAGTAAVLLIAGTLFSSPAPAPVTEPRDKALVEQTALKEKEDGYFLGEDVDRKAYMERLEAQYFAVAEKNQSMASRLEDMARKLDDLDLRVNTWSRTDPPLRAQENPSDAVKDHQLQVININPVKVRNGDGVYLPAGSFVHATLLTGVYAPSESANPLPVLIRLNEAFYGPGEARIPLEGAFAIGKATGDLTSERALVQITTISAVLPTGETFEHKGNIGYLADISGQLGLKGIVVRNTGGQMGMSFMTGVMGGASQAMADAQTTVVSSDNGHTARNVTGSRAKNAAFEGLARSAAQMSKYYEDQLEKIIPAVKVEAGVDVYLIILEGVKVHGLKKNERYFPGFID